MKILNNTEGMIRDGGNVFEERIIRWKWCIIHDWSLSCGMSKRNLWGS